MSAGHAIAAAVLGIGLLLVTLASYYGWGLTNDAQALARASSVRGGSLHQRHFYGGGPGFGK